MDLEKLKKTLRVAEEDRAFAYDDATGKAPVLATWEEGSDGHLHLVASNGQLTIGVGHNLTANGIPKDITEYLLLNDIAKHAADLDRSFPWWRTLNDCRQRALVELCFNMGISGLKKFVKFLEFLKAGVYESAARELRYSLWYSQVHATRGDRIIHMIEQGQG